MNYHKYPTLDAAQGAVSYKIVSPDAVVEAVTGLSRTSFVRWVDAQTDLLASMYVGLTPGPQGNQYPTKFVFVYQGRGGRADLSTAGAPPNQHGTFRLPDGREATWSLGVAQDGWRPTGPAWVGWRTGDDSVVVRAEGVGFDVTAMRKLAEALSQAET